ncbi:MAG: DUF3560 domain-containing protein [Actinobacteria bacterium]|nr:MAG: DUF3560 domain-containing protein [Actinomycetota bacterium]
MAISLGRGGQSCAGEQIPLGQPILVGHQSQRRAERDQARIEGGTRNTIEHRPRARDFRQRAANPRRRTIRLHGGACGTCKAKLLAGTVEMDHNYAVAGRKRQLRTGWRFRIRKPISDQPQTGANA